MHIVFPLYHGVTQLDFTGPVQILSRIPGATIHLVAGNAEAIQTDAGFAVLPTVTYADCPAADVICIPGGPGTAAACQDEDLLTFLETQVQSARWITSVCTGMFLLGKLGLLVDRKATSHWGYTHLISECGARHSPGRYVVDGNIVTGGGVTAGIDFALHLTTLIADEETAHTIQLALEYDPAPPFHLGTPERASPAVLAKLQPRYAAAADEIRAVLTTE
ncbi:MAG: DJ-1/PfpI family protein [Pseudomonadota bacterium]